MHIIQEDRKTLEGVIWWPEEEIQHVSLDALKYKEKEVLYLLQTMLAITIYRKVHFIPN